MIAASISDIGKGARAEARAVGGAAVATMLLRRRTAAGKICDIGAKPRATGENRGAKPGVTMVLVKEVRLADYLRIDKDVLWVTPDVWEQFKIMSNVEWRII